MKYNPSFLDDNELIETFVVRQAYLKLVMGTVRKNTHDTNQHLLIIGPRGSGKTTLVRRAAAEVRRDPEYNEQWYPLLFGEESYEVASAGQFWLEAIHHLSNQEKGSVWASVYEELRREMDEERLRIMALGKLMDFADEQGKRILLVVENLNQILGEQVDDRDGWKLRETLMNEPRIMLLGSATNRFDAIDNSKMAMYEQFKTLELEPLNEKECKTIWEMVTDNEISENEARAVRILTGGSPRLLTILSSFGKDKSFQTLMEDLTYLVDDHTDYFKSNMESLPPVERKVFACLASLWEEASAKEVAEAARISTSKASALLKRLEVRGIVTSSPPKGRKKYYQLAERLYNIYYLMRRGQNSGRVKAVVRFMIGFYGENRLPEAAADIIREISTLGAQEREFHYLALCELLKRPKSQAVRERIISTIMQEILEHEDFPNDLINLIGSTNIKYDLPEMELLNEIEQSFESGDIKAAADKVQDFIKSEPDNLLAWLYQAQIADETGDYVLAEKLLLKATDATPESSSTWALLGGVQRNLKKSREAEISLNNAIKLDPESLLGWIELGETLSELKRYEESIQALTKVVELDPNFSGAWERIGNEQLAFGYLKEAELALRKAIELNSKSHNAWGLLSLTLLALLNEEESLKALYKSIDLAPYNILGLTRAGAILSFFGKQDESKNYLAKALKLTPTAVWLVDELEPVKDLFAKAIIKQDNADEILNNATEHVENASIVELKSQLITDILSALVALGYQQKVLTMIGSSPSAGLLEPLVAGIKLYLGQEIKAPQEVKEIAADVVKRIKEWEVLIEEAKAESE